MILMCRLMTDYAFLSIDVYIFYQTTFVYASISCAILYRWSLSSQSRLLLSFLGIVPLDNLLLSLPLNMTYQVFFNSILINHLLSVHLFAALLLKPSKYLVHKLHFLHQVSFPFLLHFQLLQVPLVIFLYGFLIYCSHLLVIAQLTLTFP